VLHLYHSAFLGIPVLITVTWHSGWLRVLRYFAAGRKTFGKKRFRNLPYGFSYRDIPPGVVLLPHGVVDGRGVSAAGRTRRGDDGLCYPWRLFCLPAGGGNSVPALPLRTAPITTLPSAVGQTWLLVQWTWTVARHAVRRA